MAAIADRMPTLLQRLTDQLRTRDPDGDAARRALRAAIVLPIAGAVSFAVAANTSTPVFAIVGSIILLIAANFPGTTGTRALAYCGLALNGTVLITLGTLVAPHPWVAVPVCFAVGALVSFFGLVSETLAAGQRATLMTFVLPVCIRPVGPLGDRLFGWVIALLICVPAALFLFPPRFTGKLRRQATRVCAALADRIEGTCSAEEVRTAMDALSAGVRSSAVRPVSMTAGSRALIRVTSNLQWLADRVGPDTGALLGAMNSPATRVLRACAGVLGTGPHPGTQAELDDAVVDLRTAAFSRYRDDVVAILGESDDAAALDIGRTALSRRTMGSTIGLTGRIIAAAAAADSRPLWARLLGRQLPETGFADRVYTKRAAVASLGDYLSTGSVTALNSLRTGTSLALALLVTTVLPIQNAPWVVLGTLSVLRSSALTTGTTALRAVAGTVIGLVAGAIIFILLGTDPVVLWVLLPMAVFGSTYVMTVGSFTASQAMFTLMVLTVFNVIAPTGWQLGLIRIEDIVVGSGVGLMVSVLMWPRGAVAAVQRTFDASVQAGGNYLSAAVSRVTRGASEHLDGEVGGLSRESLTAVRSYGDAVRNYLSESAGAVDSTMLDTTNRIPRLRVAADLIADIVPPPPGVYPRAREVIEAHTAAVRARLASSAPAPLTPISDDFIPALRAEAPSEQAVDAALGLVTTAANISELEMSDPALLAESNR